MTLGSPQGGHLQLGGVRHSFAELAERARHLQLPPLERQDRVALVAHTSEDVVCALLALWQRSCVPVCLPPPPRLGRGPDPKALAQAAGARYLWESPHFPAGPPCQDSTWRSDDVALIQFSSGTTLNPRPVALTHANLNANVDAILSRLPGRPQDHSCVSWLPLYHDMGLIGSLLTALSAPGDLTLLRPAEFAARPGRWLQTLSETRATISPAPNFALVQCLERDQPAPHLDLSAWQLALLGGETISATTLERFYEKYRPYGLRWEALTPVYGLAEATLAVTFTPPGRGPLILERDGRRLVSVGRPLPGMELKIVQGRVHVKGPSVMRGYLGQPPLEGWLDTGDLGFLEDGELYLTGRAKDLLILNGRNHEPEAVEEALSGVDGLDPSRSAAFAVDDPDHGTEALVLVVESPRGPTPPDLAARARDAVARGTGLLARVTVAPWGSLPRTTSGKVRRGAARELFLEGQLGVQ